MSRRATDTRVLAAGALQITFERMADRYLHRVALAGDEGPHVLVESMEGTDLDAWPASAPLQDLHLEERPGGVQLALLVGKAGGSHWSLSCEVAPVGEATFDFACRLPKRPVWLGSTYRIVAPASEAASGGVITWRCGAANCELRADLAIQFQADRLLLPVPEKTGPWPLTVQWKYRFSAVAVA